MNSDVDIVAIQESNLRKTDKTLSIEGYATIRKDQNNILGCSLLFFVHNIIFEKLHSFQWAGMKILFSQVCKQLQLSRPALIQTPSIHLLTP